MSFQLSFFTTDLLDVFLFILNMSMMPSLGVLFDGALTEDAPDRVTRGMLGGTFDCPFVEVVANVVK